MTSTPTGETSRDAAGYAYLGNPTTEAAAVRAQYAEQAASYDQSMVKWGFSTPEQSTAVLLRHVKPEAEILELGCGTGFADLAHYEAGYHNLDGVDLSTDMLAEATKKNIHQGLLCADVLEGLPIRDGVYDAAVCVGVLTHFKDSAPVLSEMIRVVKRGGHILFSQRSDLFEKQNMEALLARLESEGSIRKVEQTDWLVYCANHQAYIEANIRVAYFVYEVLV